VISKHECEECGVDLRFESYCKCRYCDDCGPGGHDPRNCPANPATWERRKDAIQPPKQDLNRGTQQHHSHYAK
jgi:hypothetical protein